MSLSLFKNKKKLDIKSQELIYEMFYSRVYKTAYFITKDTYLAQDVMQETFIKAFKNYHNLKDKEKIGSWLNSIATRQSIDLLRKEKIRNHLNLEDVSYNKLINDSESLVESEIEGKIFKNEIQASIEQLQFEYRAVLVLKYMYELKEQEIANILNLELGTVKSRIHRAKGKLRMQLEKSKVIEEGI